MNKSVKNKRLFLVLFLTIFLLLCIIFSIGNYALNVACLPDSPRKNNLEMCMEEVFNKYPEMRSWRDSLLEAGLWRDTFVTAEDGLKRHAYILTHNIDTVYFDKETGDDYDLLGAYGATVVVHGYCDNCARMMRYYYLHYEVLHRNCLVPDLYSHGLSEGENIRFGWLDRLDLTKIWLPMTHNIWPDLNIVQHGLSMGGATTMMTSGEEIPDSLNLIGFIEDCGYNSTYEQLSEKIKTEVGLPAFPFLDAADILCKWRFGWSMKESDAEKQLAKCTRPMLFIHGDADSYVPFYMLQKNYDAKTQGYKEMWVAPGSEHAQSIHDRWEDYISHVKNYIATIENL